jgi:hypothetical protein
MKAVNMDNPGGGTGGIVLERGSGGHELPCEAGYGGERAVQRGGGTDNGLTQQWKRWFQ